MMPLLLHVRYLFRPDVDVIGWGESPASEAADFSRQNYRDFPLGSPPQAAGIVRCRLERPYDRLRKEKGIVMKRRPVLGGLNLMLLAVVLLPTGRAMAVCDTPPACQCECLDEWDRCAEGMSTEEARKECDPDYDDCYEENCSW